MGRPTADYDITSKTARLRLRPRETPYYRGLGGDRSLGYVRRESGPGTWKLRERIGTYRWRTVGSADDYGPADGRDVLTYEQAVKIAVGGALPAPGKLTVNAALDVYLDGLAARSDHAKEARQRAAKHIRPALGTYPVAKLTKRQIESWRDGLVRDDPDDPDAKRRSQDSANRILNTLRAALNAAFADDDSGITSDSAWRKVKAFRGVAGSREDHFEATQLRKLIAEAAKFDKAFADLCEAGYLTGARYGELGGLEVRDFDAGRAMLSIRDGKTGARPVTLSSEGVAFFRKRAEKRPRNAVLLPRADGDQWGKSEQFRPFRVAAKAAKLPASASFYSLRHSHISRAIEAGMPLSLIAENCGTSLTMIQRNYAKVLAATRRDTIERTAPKLRRVK